MACTADALFFALQVFFPAVPAIPQLLLTLLYARLYAGTEVLIWRWATASGWRDQHPLALTSGVVLTYMR